MDQEYEKVKNMFDARSGNDTDYDAKREEYFNEEYRETGIYNEYDVVGNANRDFEEMMRNHPNVQKNIYITSCAPTKVKRKEVMSQKKSGLKKLVVGLVVSGMIAGATVVGTDVLNHPENYDSTHPEFEGGVTFSEMIERTPENIDNIVGRGM